MSADHWGICPRCKTNREKQEETHKQQVINAYGKLPVEEYLALRNYEFPELQSELREDYEIGINPEGIFYISYKGLCYSCKFAYEYNYEVQVYP